MDANASRGQKMPFLKENNHYLPLPPGPPPRTDAPLTEGVWLLKPPDRAKWVFW